MSPEQELLNILFQGEMELTMKRVMSFELSDESVRMYMDNTGWVVSHSEPNKVPELYSYAQDKAGEALDKFDFLANVIRLRIDQGKDQKNSECGS